MSDSSKAMTAGSIVGIVIGCLFGALYLYCCLISARKAIRDRRAKIARNTARRKAKAFREHHQEIARKFHDVRGNGKAPDPLPYILDDGGGFGRKVSILSVDGIRQPTSPSVFVNSRRRSSTTIPAAEVLPKVTLLPNRKFAITKENANSMAANNSARPPPGLLSGSVGTRYQMPPYPQPPSAMGGPIFPGGAIRIPLAMREESLDDASSMSSEVSSFISGSHYALYAGPSFRRRNSYESAMRRTNLPPVAHPLRDPRAQAAAAAAARTIDRMAEEEAIRRREREKERQIVEDIEGEKKAILMDRYSRENISMKRHSVGCSSSTITDGNDADTLAGSNSMHDVPESTGSVQCPVWIHPDNPNSGYKNSGYSDSDYHNYL